MADFPLSPLTFNVVFCFQTCAQCFVVDMVSTFKVAAGVRPVGKVESALRESMSAK